MPKGLSPLNWLDDFLYLPEVLYMLFFIWLICSGPGKFSVDYWLAGKLREVIDRRSSLPDWRLSYLHDGSDWRIDYL